MMPHFTSLPKATQRFAIAQWPTARLAKHFQGVPDVRPPWEIKGDRRCLEVECRKTYLIAGMLEADRDQCPECGSTNTETTTA